MNPHPFQPYWTEKAKDAMREKANSGVLPGCAPLGYRNVLIEGVPSITIDPETAPLVKEAFLLAAKRKMSLRKILVVLDEQGLRSRNGRMLGVSSLHTMLANPFYTGIVRWEGKLIRGAHEPLVDEKVFCKVKRPTAGHQACICSQKV